MPKVELKYQPGGGEIVVKFFSGPLLSHMVRNKTDTLPTREALTLARALSST